MLGCHKAELDFLHNLSPQLSKSYYVATSGFNDNLVIVWKCVLHFMQNLLLFLTIYDKITEKISKFDPNIYNLGSVYREDPG